MKFSSVAAPEVVKMIAFSAANGENFVQMTTFPFQCTWWYHKTRTYVTNDQFNLRILENDAFAVHQEKTNRYIIFMNIFENVQFFSLNVKSKCNIPKEISRSYINDPSITMDKDLMAITHK